MKLPNSNTNKLFFIVLALSVLAAILFRQLSLDSLIADAALMLACIAVTG